ncbi:helix-turn-helix domain-containing protein [Loigolactobacillus bifermentans]|uniref:helix-turn-helix domain-containing protein n=1 Tax=Loigolactobacillus bifermentans TaxID=1607 RepID=UPI00070E884A|nr:helix-turn-helix domain-containing protein [Loigolactobacillus bifermentans]QGG60114.1 XRE family transcriptional regulator [Loigolactobacillus bifermentans]
MENDTKIIGARIMEFINARDTTIHRTAVKAGIPNTTLVDLISGTTKNARVSTVRAVCAALDISVHDFFDFAPYNEVEK